VKQTPLTAKHRALGGRMIEYAGFEMPVQYTGLVDEHLTVRSKVGILTSPTWVNWSSRARSAGHGDFLGCNDASQLQVGEIQYTCLTNERGGIIDDILVYRTEQGFCSW